MGTSVLKNSLSPLSITLFAIKVYLNMMILSLIKYIHGQIFKCKIKLYIYMQGGRGHWAGYYTSPQSFIIILFLFSGLTALGNFIINFQFSLVGSFSWVSKCFNHLLESRKGVILCFIIGDVNLFISHCLILFDPLFKYDGIVTL